MLEDGEREERKEGFEDGEGKEKKEGVGGWRKKGNGDGGRKQTSEEAKMVIRSVSVFKNKSEWYDDF